ncbi:MAG: TIGR03067 domain-containing protein [Gemmatales bacterium]|nr:TIGR03067 domain-containing protein [Gemmatales bacterium]MDW8221569.1 TIGR03067 domain-containing protein [Gemmatales bacterium]
MAFGQDLASLRKRDLALLQGEWRAIAGERDGQARPKTFLQALHVQVADDMMILSLGKRQQKLRIVLNPSVRPRSIEVIHLEGKEQGEVWSGIYLVEGQRWKLCLAPPGTPRPQDFYTRPGSGWELLILERKNPMLPGEK